MFHTLRRRPEPSRTNSVSAQMQIRSASECLDLARDVHARAMRCNDPRERIAMAQLADEWRKVARLADQQAPRDEDAR